MKLIDYISNAAIPMVILVIILVGVSEKKKVYELFVEGAKEGTKIVFNIFPTLLGLFVAIGALRSSGIINLITNFLTPFLNVKGKLETYSRLFCVFAFCSYINRKL